MKRPSGACVLSIEQECQTTFTSTVDRRVEVVLGMFFEEMSRLAPALPGNAGIFNGYGRVYVDTHAHLEFAFCECDCPYRLAQVVETQYALARRATEALSERGVELLLVNNNHCGLLRRGTAFWGTHENYLVGGPATTLTALAIPFLVTRIFAGSGGVLAPGARFLAGARHLAMQASHDDGVTTRRSIFSTSRQEHHLAAHDPRERLHLLLGDGHRSQFNTALHVGATALAVKAMEHDRELPALLSGVALRNQNEGWIEALERLSVLAEPGSFPTVAPVVIEVQRIFLDAARRTVDTIVDPPEWMESILVDWSATLDAYERTDRRWLSARLDAYIKYELYSHYLAESGRSWADVVQNVDVLSELTLLDHDYHTISSKASIFESLQERGLLRHRVEPQIEPGAETDAYVPDVRTRARARARFIKEHAGTARSGAGFSVSWEHIRESDTRRVHALFDPFATEYSSEEVASPSEGGIFEALRALRRGP